MMAYNTPKDTREIQNKLVTWLEANLVDPYEQSTGTTRSTFVNGDDFKIQINSPDLQVDFNDMAPENIVGQGKTNYLEEEVHQFIFYYHVRKGQLFTFPDNSLELKDEAQASKYLQYVRNTLKSNMTSFNDYFHRAVFGSVSKPKWSPQTKRFTAMMPMTVRTYRR